MINWYSKDKEYVCDKLEVTDKGLNTSEVKKRIEKYGKNTLPKQKKDSVLKIFFSEFKDPMIILLMVAIFASLIAGEVVDAIAIIL